jgi:Tol biopolymer transport system component
VLVVADALTGRSCIVASHACGDAQADPWSPDGRTLALVVSSPHHGCNGPGLTQVAVTDAARGGMRRITPAPSTFVTWSSDGRQLLVQRSPRSSTDMTMALADPRTGRLRRVAACCSAFAGGSWSHDRRHFATRAVVRATHLQEVVVFDPRFVRDRRLGSASAFAWGPRADLLGVADDHGVRVLDAATGRQAASIPASTPYGLAVQSLAWSPDGRSLLMVASPAAGHD